MERQMNDVLDSVTVIQLVRTLEASLRSMQLHAEMAWDETRGFAGGQPEPEWAKQEAMTSVREFRDFVTCVVMLAAHFSATGTHPFRCD